MAFLKYNDWFSGPDLLKAPESDRPNLPAGLDPTHPDDSEIKKIKITVNAVLLKDCDSTSKLILYFSDWNKLQRELAWFLKLKDLLIKISRKRKEVVSCTLHVTKDDKMRLVERQIQEFKEKLQIRRLSMVDLKDSETAIICSCQAQGFTEEMATLKKGNSSVKSNSPIFNLDPILDRGLLRVED